ncbi:MAG: amidase [Cumulibacter sp.]
MQPREMTMVDLATAIAQREISPREVVESSLECIEALEPQVGAFATVTADHARAQAVAAEKDILAGRYRGPLHGIPIAIKDLINTAGIATTSSSQVRAGYVPEDDAAVIRSLNSAGAVMVGKAHTHEFAFGATTPTTRNPWDLSRIPGGSSGGTAAAIAYGAVHAGLGSDTGGSIRIPAALCGTVGLKPTYGLVPRTGVTSLSWSLDHVGPLTRNVADAAFMMNAIATYDGGDPASVRRPSENYARLLSSGIEGMRIGVPTNWFTEHVDAEVASATSAGIEVLLSLGAEIVEVEIPMTTHLTAMEWAIMMPEASAYHRKAMRNCPELFTEETRQLLEVGETILATDYVDALRMRQLFKAAWMDMMADCDVLVAPSTFAPAVPAEDPVYEFPDGRVEAATPGYVRLSLPMNLTGLPSLQIPCGLNSSGLPLGLQIMGKPFSEASLLGVGAAYEAATENVGLVAPLGSLAAA